MIADERQEVFKEFEVPDPVRIEKAARLVRAHLPSLRGATLLECGVAKGGLADTLKREGVRCVGVDINPRTLEGVEVYEADLNAGFPKFDTAFNVIFAGEVVEHLYDDEKFVQEAHELLKPDGLLVITVPNLAFSVNRIRALFGMVPLFAYAPYHYHVYTQRTLQELLRRNGFSIEDLVSSHILFSTRRNRFFGRLFEFLGDIFPSLGAHLIVCARKV
jgi:2-polyprenyl-3-methyl-5-hydroxy-6-metoxy-1,4-benzoquinol methylase